MSPTLDVQSALPRRQRRYGLARWWLAGLLVSCLLPASLSPTDAFRGGERSVTICFWVPAILRAQSHWVAKRRRALQRWAKSPQRFAPVRRLCHWLAPMAVLVAAQDVLTQRGPPSRQACR
ncbi:hypothetical protein KF947_20140 [Halomonas sp. FeN2]|uniref:hypothetical protein n=1 Tax=Halomonas sp. FeN2 TaxID=2832500 RepID=UPI000C4A7DEC|nr:MULTISPECIES: hypothetical protein [unclassified Halomonas]MBF57426.1 hypothetical protein [Halomonas sp.]UBR49602.1 hypothetical protein KF947_20140 [Halomonas sp. FeN2]|tara:strand:+ start:1565 stop:1927 length:363 start_codon:yes stop_codon:yes gene_type:complete